MAEHRRREDERMEEVRELRRVEEQQRCMQAEYDEEQKRMKEKEDEVEYGVCVLSSLFSSLW